MHVYRKVHRYVYIRNDHGLSLAVGWTRTGKVDRSHSVLLPLSFISSLLSLSRLWIHIYVSVYVRVVSVGFKGGARHFLAGLLSISRLCTLGWPPVSEMYYLLVLPRSRDGERERSAAIGASWQTRVWRPYLLFIDAIVNFPSNHSYYTQLSKHILYILYLASSSFANLISFSHGLYSAASYGTFEDRKNDRNQVFIIFEIIYSTVLMRSQFFASRKSNGRGSFIVNFGKITKVIEFSLFKAKNWFSSFRTQSNGT